jgi:hypothetical protein
MDSSLLSGTLIIGGFCGAGLVFVFFVLPFVSQVLFGFEMFNMIIDAIGEYIGNQTLARFGCLTLVVAVFGCCLATFVAAIALTGCFIGSGNQLCRLIGR